MLELRGVSRSWGGFSLKDIDLKVGKGEYFVILGPTGSGKTLLLETIAGFVTPEKGSVLLDGRRIDPLPPEKRGFGFVYQDYLLFPHKSVAENIRYGLERTGGSGDIEGKVKAVSGSLGISHLLHRRPGTLSGGEMQRAALARALVTEPPVLLLDEPLSAVDPVMRDGIRAELKTLHRRSGTTFIHVTHDRTDPMVLADRMAVMRDGRIVQVGTPREVFLEPRSEFVARFVGVENIFSGRAVRRDGMTVFTSEEGVAISSSTPAEGPCTASVRPEDIILTREASPSSARNLLRGRVEEMVDTGPVVRVTLDCGVHFVVFATREACSDLSVEAGKEMYMMFKASAVNLF